MTQQPTNRYQHYLRLTCCIVFFLLFHVLAQGQDKAEQEVESKKTVMRLVTVLSHDQQDNPLTFPANVSAEPDQQEIYVLNSGKRQILVYDRDFFPHFVLGAGRGIDGPKCIFFDRRHSRILIGQHGHDGKPARLTILNAAFLLEKEVTFPVMPDGQNFTPTNGMVTDTGKIYLTGEMARAVLVLNYDGSFSHWLEIKGSLFVGRVKTTDSSSQRQHQLDIMTQESQGQGSNAQLDTLPESLRPQTTDNMPRSQQDTKGQEAIIIHDVATNSAGHLFFLSQETSKIYVYNPGEKFLFSFGEKGGSGGKMSRPRGLAIDEKKKCIYVVDYMRHTILVYNMAGRYLFEFGGQGKDPLWFNFPTAIDVDSQGRIIIADLFNNRIQVLETDFKTSYPVFGNTRGVNKQKK